MHITADELFDKVVDDSLDMTINSIISTSSSRHSSSQLTQQKRSTSALPATRRSNLQTPTAISVVDVPVVIVWEEMKINMM